MIYDTNNYIFIGKTSPYTNDFYIHECAVENGKPGKIVKFVDGRGDISDVAQGLIKDGFDPKKIVMNGVLASDVFETQNNNKQDKFNNHIVVECAPWTGAIKYEQKNRT